MAQFYETLAELAANLQRERAEALEATHQPASLGLAEMASSPMSASMSMASQSSPAMGAPPPGALAALAGAGGAPGGAPIPGTGGYVPQGGNLVTRAGVTMISPAMQELIKIKQATGLPIFRNVVSDYRTRAQQAALYQAYLNGTGNLAAPPGSSMHESGRALDISTAFLQANPALGQALLAAGWTNDVPGEPWHWQYG